MSGMNTGKVLAGGLAAGVVLNVMDFVANMLLAADYSANSARLGLDPAAMENPATIATWVGVDLALGLLLVFTYASVRPRFGAGPKTAVVAGVLIWLGISLVLFGMTVMGILDMGLYVKASLVSLVNVLVASAAGGWVYREE